MKKYYNKLLGICLFIVLVFAFSYSQATDGCELPKIEFIIALGIEQKYFSTFVSLKNDEVLKKVNQVVHKVAKASGQLDTSYEVTIINHPSPIVSSSFGYVYISTGLLDNLTNEDELAYAIAHSIAHIMMDHQLNTYLSDAEKYNSAWKKARSAHEIFLWASLLQAVTLGVAGIDSNLVVMLLAGESSLLPSEVNIDQKISNAKNIHLNKWGASLAEAKNPNYYVHPSLFIFLKEFFFGYEAEDELKADEVSIKYVTKAGYNPNAVITLLENLLKERTKYLEKEYISHFIFARPGIERRLESVKKFIK